MMKHTAAPSAASTLDAGKKRPSMDLGVHDQDRFKRTKDAADKASAVAAAAVAAPAVMTSMAGTMPQYPGGATMHMPLVPPGPWTYPSSFPLMPPMGPLGMPFCFPPAFFPAPFMFPHFWFANAMSACSAAGAGMPGTAAAMAPGTHAGTAAPATGAANPAAAMPMAMPGMPMSGMAPFAPLPMMAAAESAAAASMQQQQVAPVGCAAPVPVSHAAPVPVAAPLPTALLQQLTGSMDAACSLAGAACGYAPDSSGCPMPAPRSVDCCGPALSDSGSGSVTPSVSDGSIAAPATPEVNDISDQEFVSFIDSFLNLPDDGLGCSIPLGMGGEEDASVGLAGCNGGLEDDDDLTGTLGLGLKLSKSDSLLNLLDRELACAANASAAAGFSI